jgi:hypothetical protein
MSEGMTLQQFIETLIDMVKDEPQGVQIEVVAHTDDGEAYTPVIGLGPEKDGIRRISVS